MEARYLNVDLVIQSDSDLTELTLFLEGKAFFLWKELNVNQSSIGVETNLHDTTEPEQDIVELLNIIESMPPKIQQLWLNCKKRLMDIGFECGTITNPINASISIETVKRLAKADCAINVRIYGGSE